MSIHKKALFYGYNRYFEPPVHENGRFYGREAKNNILSTKSGQNVDKMTPNKKETPPKGCLRTSIDLIRLVGCISAASSASARLSRKSKQRGRPTRTK